MKAVIGFSRSNKILSKLIQWVTKSKVSHTYLRFYNNPSIVFHAQKTSVRAVGSSTFLQENEIVREFEVEITPEKYRWFTEQLGKSYGFLTLIGFILPIFFKLKNPFNDGESSFVCSELVGVMMDIPNPEDLTPELLYKDLVNENEVQGS